MPPRMDRMGNIRKELRPKAGQIKSSTQLHKTQSQAWNLIGPFRVWDEFGNRTALLLSFLAHKNSEYH